MLVSEQKKIRPARQQNAEPVRRKAVKPDDRKRPQPTRERKPTRGKQPESVNRKQTQPAEPSEPKKARGGVKAILSGVLIAALVLVMIGGVTLSVVSMHNEKLQRKITLIYAGILQEDFLFPINLTDSEVESSVQATKRHGMTRAFTYFCNDTLRLNEASLSGYIYFGNPAENDCDLVLTVFADDGRLVYRSGGVQPGNYITRIQPFGDVTDKETVCTAYVSAYKGSGKNYKCIGVQYSRLVMKVGETS